MIQNWTTVLKNVLEQTNNFSKLVNEDHLKTVLVEKLNGKADIENDMLIQTEIPWYDRNEPGRKLKHYIDIVILRKGVFEMDFSNPDYRRKGYHYNSHSMAVMLKFVKPKFEKIKLKEDLDKLKYFAEETNPEENKPVFIIYCVNEKLYLKTIDQIKNYMDSYEDSFKNRILIAILHETQIQFI